MRRQSDVTQYRGQAIKITNIINYVVVQMVSTVRRNQVTIWPNDQQASVK